MACVLTSDDRVGEVLLSRVVQDQLADVPLSEGLLPETQRGENEQEEKIINQMALMIRKIGESVEKDAELNEMINGLAQTLTNRTNYLKVVQNVFDDGCITWGRIAVLFYVAGRTAVKVVIAQFPQYVKDILAWTLDFFKSKLLSWVQENGGWLSSFSELARFQVERMNSMSGWTSGIILVFIGGVLLGSVITWKVASRT